MFSVKDLTNSPPFGRLKVLERGPNAREGAAQWWCICSCGGKVLVRSQNLIRRNTKSCGCLNREKIIQRHTIHGCSRMPEYTAWRNMRRRCLNPRDKAYMGYGGRGITICERWLESFENFFADMGPRPEPHLTLERKNNDGPYSPENCAWATKSEQSHNTRRSLFVRSYGEIVCTAEDLHRSGLSRSTFLARLRNGWSIQRALSVPLKTNL